MTALVPGTEAAWKTTQRQIEAALEPLRKDVAAGQAVNDKLLENVDVLRQAIEQILAVATRATAYATAGVRDVEAFSDIRAFAQNALDATKGVP